MGGPGSGGARVRSGPPRDPNATRRRSPSDRHGFVRLPAAGRDGDLPDWPLPRPTRFERDQWESEWRRPQAVMWERLGLELQVAIYVRTLGQATKAGAAATRTTSLLRQMDNLGLTVPGMASNRWIIDDVPQASPAPRRTATTSAKDRLAIIRGGADARAS